MTRSERLASHEQTATAALVAALAEFDARRLYLARGCSSLFMYCTRVLHILAPVLTEQNHRDLLHEARHCSKREVEMIVARINPRPDAPCIITPLGPDRFKVQFTISGETYGKLCRGRTCCGT